MTTPGPTDPKPPLGLNPPVPSQPTPASAPSTPSATPAVVPAPTTKTPAATTPTPKPASAAGAYVVAVLALVIAVVAGGAAAYAVKTAWDVRDNGTPAALTETSVPATGTAPATPETSAATASPSPTRATVSPTPTGPTYEPQFVNVSLQIPAPSGCLPAYVDVDSATTGSDQGHEFYLTTCQNGALQVRLDRTSGRAVVPSGTTPTATDCAAAVRGSGTAELVLPAEAGVTFCLLTNRAQANASGLTQKLAIVTIDSISAANRVTLVLSTFTVND